MQEGIVFNIQRFTIHDGPGMRTELFLKGCPLRCAWCSNPESQIAYPQPGVYASRCIGEKGCGACRKACPLGKIRPAQEDVLPVQEGALLFQDGLLQAIDRDSCTNCMNCSEACPADAIRRWGERMTTAECMETILRDRSYYETSGGGVTVSGGEPLLQSAFVKELFAACRAEGIHTCLESTLAVDWAKIADVLPVTDLVIADLKMMDSEKHRTYTGVGNEQILENLVTLAREWIPSRRAGHRKGGISDSGTDSIILRIPVIPGINDDDENIRRSADFILGDMQGRIDSLQLLSFMFLGEEKYRSLDMPYRMHDMLQFEREAFQEKVEKIADYFLSRGISTSVGNRKKA